MGNKTSKQKNITEHPFGEQSPLTMPEVPKVYNLFNIRNNYDRYEDIQKSLTDLGLEKLNIIFGIDYSNDDGNNLHQISQTREILNPFQYLIKIIGAVLEPFNEGSIIRMYGFGNKKKSEIDSSLFSFNQDGEPFYSIDGVLEKYSEMTPKIEPSNEKNFSPIIDEAINLVRRTGGKYHVLFILTNGQLNSWAEINETFASIIDASNFALSIVLIGINKDCWKDIEKYDDQIPERKFVNFHFMNFDDVMTKFNTSKDNKRITEKWDVAIALNALWKLPEQYSAIKVLGISGQRYGVNRNGDILIYPDFSVYTIKPNAPY